MKTAEKLLKAYTITVAFVLVMYLESAQIIDYLDIGIILGLTFLVPILIFALLGNTPFFKKRIVNPIDVFGALIIDLVISMVVVIGLYTFLSEIVSNYLSGIGYAVVVGISAGIVVIILDFVFSFVKIK